MGEPSRAEPTRVDLTRVRQLLRVTARLSSTITEYEIAAILLGEGVPALGASTGAIWRLHDGQLELAGTQGYTGEEIGWVERLPLEPTIPVARAVLDQAPVWIRSWADYRARFPLSAGRTTGAATEHELAVACVPLQAEHDRVLGVLAFAFRTARSFDDDERAFIELLAQHCAQAIQRALLSDAERTALEHAEEARRLSEEARERAAFLARASTLLSASLDYQETLRSVARLAVPRIADWVGIEIGTPEDSEQVAVAHVDPARVAYAHELRRRYPPDRASPRGVAHVIRTGVSELYADISDAMLVAGAIDAEHLRIARALGLRSAVAVPIRSHGAVLGAITFVTAESGRRYGPDDVAMAEQLGERAGLAISNARLYDAERRIRARIDQVQQATAAFAAVRTLDEVAAVTVDLATRVVAARRIVLWQLDPDADALTLVAAVGLEDAERAANASIPLASPLPLAAAVRTGQAAFFTDGDLRKMGEAPWILSGAVIPLVVQDRRVGALGIGFDEARGFNPEEQDFLRAVGHQCAQAMDRVRADEELVRAVAVRDDFLSIAGHELKTPLTAVHLQLHSILTLAKDPAAPPRLHERATKVYAQSKRLARLVDELLDVSRVSRGRLVLDREDLDLGELVAECVARLDDEARRAGAEVRLQLAPGVRGSWDRLRLDQVITNLHGNAIKYGNRTPIDVIVEDRGATAAVIVRDRGIGIAPDAQARIFERFERAVSSRHYGGLGLGLWITRQIVEAHGGKIVVDSAPGLGARFEVVLPRA